MPAANRDGQHDPHGTRCGYHHRLSGPVPGRPAIPGADAPPGAPSRPEPSRPDRGGRQGRRARRATARAVGRARQRAHGRERARRRVAAGRFEPHPGWRHRIEPSAVVLVDQAAALARVEQLVAAECWRGDKRAAWTAMLRRIVFAMDWTTGLVTGLTRAALGEAGQCSPRTVSRLLEWAQDAGLIVVVERGATAAFLRADRNRAPSYALVAAPDFLEEPGPELQPGGGESGQVSGPVDTSGNPPTGCVDSNPLPAGGRRLDRPRRATTTPRADWPGWQIPATAAERNAAAVTLLARIGLDGGRVPAWRARALLYRWWQAGACIAGLAHAIDHDPDGSPRGDALRGARDPLRVLGHRLAAWTGRLDQLPAHLHGRAGDYRTEQAARVVERTAAADRRQPAAPGSTAAAREAARAQLAALLAARRARRRG